eukprot:m.63554 g.63554  ORF g.63554 m.63554 type:complete len:299 (+) comp23299_c0_seq1:119-1015(+)
MSSSMPMLSLGGVDHKIPAIGFGVGTAWYKASGTNKNEELDQAIQNALDAGFRHIDEAQLYENSVVSGKAIATWLARTNHPRSSLFVTHKTMNPDMGVETVCRQSLAKMGLQYFDLYLVHAPFAFGGTSFKQSLVQVWKQMEGLVGKGLVRAIGVSNWRISDLEQIYDVATIKPACNQIEAHPFLLQPELVDWCKQHSMLVTAYAPLVPITQDVDVGGALHTTVNAIAAVHSKTPAQVLLRWNLQTGKGVLTTTSKPARLREYLDVCKFELTRDEVESITKAGEARAVPYRQYFRSLL